jgi:LacI family repressor for deo operon, udp, cdd, tsx, nupC, and nupG
MATIRDVAARAEVSTATVSRVLSEPDKVLKSTRRRVLKVINQLQYSPNAAAKSLRTFRTGKLLVTVPDISNPFFSLIIQGIEEAAQREGYAVMLGDTHHDAQREERYGEMLLRREVDGLIFLGHSMSESLRGLMKKKQLAPVVNGCEYSPKLGVPSAHVDNEAAAYEAMTHLYGLGHRQIGVITGPLASPLSRDRLRGVQSCAKKNGAARQVMVVNGDFSIESGIAGAARLFAQRKAPTAVFCFQRRNGHRSIGLCHPGGQVSAAVALGHGLRRHTFRTLHAASIDDYQPTDAGYRPRNCAVAAWSTAGDGDDARFDYFAAQAGNTFQYGRTTAQFRQKLISARATAWRARFPECG